MTSVTPADLVVEAGFYYEWTTSRSPLARKLTNYQTVPDSSIPSRQLTHGTTLVDDLIRSFDLRPYSQRTSAVQTLDSHTLKHRTQKTFHWKLWEASFHLFSAELFLVHQLRQKYGPTKESSSAGIL